MRLASTLQYDTHLNVMLDRHIEQRERAVDPQEVLRVITQHTLMRFLPEGHGQGGLSAAAKVSTTRCVL